MQRPIYTLVLVVFFMMPSLVFGQSSKKMLKEAQEKYEAGQHQEALTLLNKAVETEPENFLAYYWRGKTYRALQQTDAALNDLATASKGLPKNQEIIQEIGSVNFEAGKYNDAVVAYDHLLQLNPKSAPVLHQKALTQMKVKDFAGAVNSGTTALAFDKEDDVAMYYMAVAMDSLGNDQLSEVNYIKALSLAKESKEKRSNPKLLKPYYAGLANVQQELHKSEEAIANLNEVVKLDPQDYGAYTKRGKLKVLRLEFQDAMQDFTQSIGINGKNPDAFYERGQVNKTLGQYPAAMNDFNQSLLLESGNANVYAARGSCCHAMANYGDAVRDYKKAMELSPKNLEIAKFYSISREKYYDANRESEAPVVSITNPKNTKDELHVKANVESILIEGLVTDANPLKSIVADSKSLPLKEDEMNPAFSFTLPLSGKEQVSIQVTDVYLNTRTYTYKIVKEEVTAPVVSILKPYETIDRELFIENKPIIYLEGKISDQSKIRSIIINGTSASFPLEDLNPSFQAMVTIGTSESLTINATDVLGNETNIVYKLIREDTTGANPMGTTWVVFIENTNYKNLQRLEGPARDIADMKAALANYKIDKVIVQKDLSKAQLDKFFSIDLRDQVQKNRVKSLIIWYAGHGKFLNETGYWIPVDGDTYDEYTYYSVNNLRASIQAYTLIKHVLVISDACESGPAFYMAMRDDAQARPCGDWEITKFKSAQVITSSNKELSNDNSLFTQAFANTLNNNPNECISVELIATKVSGIVKQNQKQTPKFGKIKGLDDENGTFFFMKR